MPGNNYEEGTILRDPETGERIVLQNMQWVPVTVDSRGEAFGLGLSDTGVRNLRNTVPAIAELAGEGIAGAAGLYGAGLDALKDTMLGQPPTLGEMGQSFSSTRESALDMPFVQSLKSMPRAPEDSGARVRAGVRDIGPSDPYQRLVEDERRRSEQAKALFPNMYGLGSFGATAAEMLGLRRPIAKARSVNSARRIKDAETAATGFKEAWEKLPSSTQEKLGDTFSRKILPAMTEVPTGVGSGGRKMLEAGLEGAFLAALDDSDPVKSGMAAAGAQAAGSFGLHLGLAPIRHGKIPTTLAIAGYVAGGFVLHEMLRAAAPGPQDFFESKDFAVQTAVAAFVLGMGGALTGAGRLHGPIAAQYAGIADAVTSIPRTALQLRLNEFVKNRQEGEVAPELVSQALYKRPDMFNKDQRRSLERAFYSEDPEAFTKEVKRLIKDSPSFRRDYGELMQGYEIPEGYRTEFTPDPVRMMYERTPTHPIQRGGQ